LIASRCPIGWLASGNGIWVWSLAKHSIDPAAGRSARPEPATGWICPPRWRRDQQLHPRVPDQNQSLRIPAGLSGYRQGPGPQQMMVKQPVSFSGGGGSHVLDLGLGSVWSMIFGQGLARPPGTAGKLSSPGHRLAALKGQAPDGTRGPWPPQRTGPADHRPIAGHGAYRSGGTRRSWPPVFLPPLGRTPWARPGWPGPCVKPRQRQHPGRSESQVQGVEHADKPGQPHRAAIDRGDPETPAINPNIASSSTILRSHHRASSRPPATA